MSRALPIGGVLVGLLGGCNPAATPGTTGGASAGGAAGSAGDAADAGGGPNGGMGGESGGPCASASGGQPPFAGNGYFDGLSRLSGLPETECTITVTQGEISPTMATVGVVSFTTDLACLESAEIHFGLDVSYGLVAPANPSEPAFRTLLVGMKQDSTYHYRVAVSDGTSVCYGEDRTIETGALDAVATDFVALAEAWTSPDAAPGFIVTSRDGDAVIHDKDGDIVWAYPMWNVFSVHLSWDGKYVLGRDPGPFDLGYGGIFYRVGIDGSGPVELDAPGGDHHDFAAIPEGIAYLAKSAEGECDRVYEASVDLLDGTPIFDTWSIYQHFPDEGVMEGTEICHANRVRYSGAADHYTVSDRNKDAIAVFDTSGVPLLSIGKAPTSSLEQHVLAEGAGPGGDWHVQHGHHLYADDKLVVFSNSGADGGAILHYTISADSAALDWKYAGAGPSEIQGDVQRLPNGNFLITANQSGAIVEIAPDGQTEVSRYVLYGPTGALYRFGYSEHRPSLYGTPPPR